MSAQSTPVQDNNYLSFFSALPFVRFSMGTKMFIIVGDFNAEGPPVPIPNTEVKLCSGNNTCLETDRKDSSLLTQTERTHRKMRSFAFYLIEHHAVL